MVELRSMRAVRKRTEGVARVVLRNTVGLSRAHRGHGFQSCACRILQQAVS